MGPVQMLEMSLKMLKFPVTVTLGRVLWVWKTPRKEASQQFIMNSRLQIHKG